MEVDREQYGFLNNPTDFCIFGVRYTHHIRQIKPDFFKQFRFNHLWNNHILVYLRRFFVVNTMVD